MKNEKPHIARTNKWLREMPAREKINILLVEDRPENLPGLEAMLRKPGYSVVRATCGADALEYVLKEEPAVVLMDVDVPGMDCFQTAASIREHPKSRHTPIIFITGAGNSDVHVRQGHSIRGVDYLFKPFAPDVLRSKVSAFVDLYMQRRELRRKSILLQRERDFVSAVLNTVNSLVLVLNFKGEILRVNRAWVNVTGLTEKKLRGRKLWEFLENPAQGEKFFSNAGSAALCEDHWLIQPVPRLVSWCRTALETEDDSCKYVVVTGMDVTERKRVEEEHAARAAAERLNIELEGKVRQRTEELEGFTYSVSHDMRAPVRAVDGFTKILVEEYWDKLDDEGQRLLEIIRSNTEKMGQLIDGLLALSRLGRERIVISEVDMEDLARSAFEEERAAVGAGRDISLNLASLPPAKADKRLILQVFRNLISNALKFSRNCEKTFIEIGHMPGNGETIYYVRDNGVGFDMVYAHKLFGTFQRLHAATEFEGTGIGLATVQRIIDRHGGRVWAESKQGEGATFYFSLPDPIQERE